MARPLKLLALILAVPTALAARLDVQQKEGEGDSYMGLSMRDRIMCDACFQGKGKKRSFDCGSYKSDPRIFDPVRPDPETNLGRLVECKPSEREQWTSKSRFKLEGELPEECPEERRRPYYDGKLDMARRICGMAKCPMAKCTEKDVYIHGSEEDEKKPAKTDKPKPNKPKPKPKLVKKPIKEPEATESRDLSAGGSLSPKQSIICDVCEKRPACDDYMPPGAVFGTEEEFLAGLPAAPKSTWKNRITRFFSEILPPDYMAWVEKDNYYMDQKLADKILDHYEEMDIAEWNRKQAETNLIVKRQGSRDKAIRFCKDTVKVLTDDCRVTERIADKWGNKKTERFTKAPSSKDFCSCVMHNRGSKDYKATRFDERPRCP